MWFVFVLFVAVAELVPEMSSSGMFLHSNAPVVFVRNAGTADVVLFPSPLEFFLYFRLHSIVVAVYSFLRLYLSWFVRLVAVSLVTGVGYFFVTIEVERGSVQLYAP